MKMTKWANKEGLFQVAADEDKVLKYNDEYFYYIYCEENKIQNIVEIDDEATFHEEGYTQWQYDRGEVTIKDE